MDGKDYGKYCKLRDDFGMDGVIFAGAVTMDDRPFTLRFMDLSRFEKFLLFYVTRRAMGTVGGPQILMNPKNKNNNNNNKNKNENEQKQQQNNSVGCALYVSKQQQDGAKHDLGHSFMLLDDWFESKRYMKFFSYCSPQLLYLVSYQGLSDLHYRILASTLYPQRNYVGSKAPAVIRDIEAFQRQFYESVQGLIWSNFAVRCFFSFSFFFFVVFFDCLFLCARMSFLGVHNLDERC